LRNLSSESAHGFAFDLTEREIRPTLRRAVSLRKSPTMEVGKEPSFYIRVQGNEYSRPGLVNCLSAGSPVFDAIPA
jgi:hypothetical protein